MSLSFDQEYAIFKQYIPQGGVWNAKNKDTNLRAILYAIVSMFYKAKVYSEEMEKSLHITNIDQHCIEQWERLAGIPDEIFNKETTTSDLSKRVANVILKLTGLNISDRLSIINFIKLLYPYIKDISITNGSNKTKFPLTFPMMFGYRQRSKKIVLVKLNNLTAKNTFPLKFPYSFGQSTAEVEVFLNYIVPFPYRVKFIK